MKRGPKYVQLGLATLTTVLLIFANDVRWAILPLLLLSVYVMADSRESRRVIEGILVVVIVGTISVARWLALALSVIMLVWYLQVVVGLVEKWLDAKDIDKQ